MTDDLRERFRALDLVEFPHEGGPPPRERLPMIRIDRGRNVGTTVFALLLAVVALGFAIRAFSGPDQRPPIGPPVGGTVSPVPTGPGTCNYGPWARFCPEADWARSVVSVAGFEIAGEPGALIVATREGAEFSLMAQDPALHEGEGVTPLRSLVARGEVVPNRRIDDISVYVFRGEARFWTWSAYGLVVEVDGRVLRGSPALSDEDLVALVRASRSVPYATPTSSPSVTIPDIEGSSDQEAMLALHDVGLNWVVAYRTVEGVPSWRVVSVEPAPGTEVEPGTWVRLVVATHVTPLPAGGADALDCDAAHREAFGGPNIRIQPGGSAYITGNLPGIRRDDEVTQVTFEGNAWDGLWHVIRGGSVVAVVDFGSLDGEACQGSGVAGA